MSPQAETAIGTLLAALGAIVLALVFYFVLTQMFNVSKGLAVPIAVIVGGVQHSTLRYWLLVGGESQVGRDDT